MNNSGIWILAEQKTGSSISEFRTAELGYPWLKTAATDCPWSLVISLAIRIAEVDPARTGYCTSSPQLAVFAEPYSACLMELIQP